MIVFMCTTIILHTEGRDWRVSCVRAYEEVHWSWDAVVFRGEELNTIHGVRIVEECELVHASNDHLEIVLAVML